MNTIFNNIFADKNPKQTNEDSCDVTMNNHSCDITMNNNSSDIRLNLAKLLVPNNSQDIKQFKRTPENNNFMAKINNLNEKIIANNLEIEQKNKLAQQLANENMILRSNLQSIMRHYNLRFN